MKCTCKDWEHGDDDLRLTKNSASINGTEFRFCPWCGSPLLPDPVEKTEFIVTTNDCRMGPYHAGGSEASGMITIETLQKASRDVTFTLESITTIKRVVKIVRPKQGS